VSNVKLEMSKPTMMEVAEEGEPSELRAMTSGIIDQLGSVCGYSVSDNSLLPPGVAASFLSLGLGDR
jgi:hypothetical protein